MKQIVTRYVKPLYGRVAIGLSFKLLGSASELMLPYILAYIIDTVIPAQEKAALYKWGLLMLALSLAGVAFNIIANRMSSKVGSAATYALRNDLFEKAAGLSCAQLNGLTKPSVITRLTTDTYNIHQMLVRIQRLGVRAPILLIGGLIITMTLDAALAGILLATIPLIAVLIFFITRKSIPMYTRLQQVLDKSVRIIREDISGIRVIKALSKTDYEKERFYAVNEEIAGREISVKKTMAAIEPASNLLMNIGLLAVLALGAVLVNRGDSEIGKILAFMTYFTIILQALRSVTRIFDLLSRAAASSERISAVLNTDTEIAYGSGGRRSDDNAVTFKDVSFSYGGEPVLSGLSFSIKKGQTLGIIGETGSGKSTIVELLLRFCEADSGDILIDGVGIKSIEIGKLRGKFGVVFQNETLFEDTIRQNVGLCRDLSDAQLQSALHDAAADDFVGLDADALDGRLNIKGANLSGGQKQRILIARALAGRPEFLILDDASSALDYKTDAFIRGRLRERYGGVTTVIIAQRISAVKSADSILVLENGTGIGFGTHDELLAGCPTYREIWSSQMGDAYGPQ